jgi:hypothetical protein
VSSYDPSHRNVKYKTNKRKNGTFSTLFFKLQLRGKKLFSIGEDPDPQTYTWIMCLALSIISLVLNQFCCWLKLDAWKMWAVGVSYGIKIGTYFGGTRTIDGRQFL